MSRRDRYTAPKHNSRNRAVSGSICSSGKRTYRSMKAGRLDGKRRGLRPYRCPECGEVHLTSSTPYGGRRL